MAREISLDAKKGVVGLLRDLEEEARERAHTSYGHHALSGYDVWAARRDRYKRWADEIQNLDEIGTEEADPIPRDRDPSGCGELLREATETGWHVEMRAWPGRITAHICTDEAEWLGSGKGDTPEAALRAALDRAKGAGDA